MPTARSHPSHKLTEDEVENIHLMRSVGIIYRAIGDYHGVSATLCRYICHRAQMAPRIREAARRGIDGRLLTCHAGPSAAWALPVSSRRRRDTPSPPRSTATVRATRYRLFILMR